MMTKTLALAAAVVTLASCDWTMTPTTPAVDPTPNFYIEAVATTPYRATFDWLDDTLAVGDEVQFQGYRWEQPPQPPGCWFSCPPSYKVHYAPDAVRWSTSDASVVSVDATGLARAVGPGNAWIHGARTAADTASHPVVVVPATR